MGQIGEYDSNNMLIYSTPENYIQTVIEEACYNIRNKCFLANIGFRRKTFIQSGKCYVCNKEDCSTEESIIDNIYGTNLYGWIYCAECKPFVLIDKENRETFMNVLPRRTYRHLNRHKFKFWRKSSNPSIISYLQSDALLELEQCDGFEYKHKYNAMCANITWPSPENSSYPKLLKAIPFSNLIFHNRDVFGYKTHDMIERILSNCEYINNTYWMGKWKPLIKEQYTHANGWLEFCKVATRKEIPRDITLLILDMWGMFQLSKN
tara:strand:+ start:65 stop:856 length:792 start_codon:yes stop_codon:yes gene_type:complete